jgi:rSAM/selenodomain-associated transferase 2/rSAM/selenodomain-associated transferase 1
VHTGTPPSPNRIILFTRYPEPGQTKTRLIPALGAESAAALHKQLTEHAVKQAQAQSFANIEIAWTGGDEPSMRAWLGPQVRLREQVDGDLGTRMAAAVRSALGEGAVRALVAGCDCPDLGAETYEAAFEALQSNDLVLGPATDGGYYLIGLRATAAPAIPALFTAMKWGTDRVFTETVTRAHAAGLRVAQLAPLEDVDLPEYLPVWERNIRPRPALSVVVCALNDAARLGATLDALGSSSDVEVIVADGGSNDATGAIALARGATVVAAPRGRAAQFNLGAARASGEALLFLHADTRGPATYREEIHECLARTGVAAGAFGFATDFRSPSMRIVAASTNVRARLFQLPYGDQGLFMRRKIFHRAGGFPPIPIMEDYAFVRRLQRLGRIAIAPSAAVTSGDRWQRLGVWRTTLRNARIVALYELGTTPERLASLYRRGLG